MRGYWNKHKKQISLYLSCGIIFIGLFVLCMIILLGDYNDAAKWSAIGSLTMVFITYASLLQNRNQLDLMRRQWIEERKPHLHFSIIPSHHAYFLKVYNSGVNPAINVSLTFNQEFVNSMSAIIKDDLLIHASRPFVVEGHESKYLFLGWMNDVKEIVKSPEMKLIIVGSSDNEKIDFTIDVYDAISHTFMWVPDDMTYLMKELTNGISSSKSTAGYKTVQQSLSSIADSLYRLTNNMERNNTNTLE